MALGLYVLDVGHPSRIAAICSLNGSIWLKMWDARVPALLDLPFFCFDFGVGGSATPVPAI